MIPLGQTKGGYAVTDIKNREVRRIAPMGDKDWGFFISEVHRGAKAKMTGMYNYK